jgi:hypothetical protein
MTDIDMEGMMEPMILMIMLLVTVSMFGTAAAAPAARGEIAGSEWVVVN